MHFGINKGLKQITYDSDVDIAVETDSNDSGCHHVIVIPTDGRGRRT